MKLISWTKIAEELSRYSCNILSIIYLRILGRSLKSLVLASWKFFCKISCQITARSCNSESMRFNRHCRHLTDSRVTDTVHETNNIQIYLQLIFKFWSVNVILQQFQTVISDQNECFRSSNFPDRFLAFLVNA